MQFTKPTSIAFAVSAALFAGAGIAETPAKTAGTPGIVAKVNGVAIPESRLEFLVRQQIAAGQPDGPELRKGARDRIINQEIVAQAAVKKGLDKSPEVLQQIELTRLELLANAYLAEELKKNPPSEAALKKEYDAIVAQMGKNEYKGRHILVESEDEAKKIVADLKKGAKFEKLAEKSKDAGSAKNGGDLGWFPPDQMVKPFADAVAKLKKGETTPAPVQTQFGWHVIRLDDTRPRQVPAFEQVKPQLEQQAQRLQVQKIVEDLHAKAKVE